MTVKDNLIRLSLEESTLLCQAEDLLNQILNTYEEEGMTGEVLTSCDGLPYVMANIDDAWQALYKLNIETGDENTEVAE